ncbi:hypothetical protein Cs7R123_65480 [Catellatospora sp. TT07R-123]|uniref:hypothetical protein n=1 Tax=Catellatospora sp. TT07R-123 TaxID=2733863 RepID=UPI001B179B54|nr:hypothetical protein [Catellatospora sp. TT07R-123]GHJ49206.1 hypothetical protein Cs7R123_65480 [Catellatospora sp. TT07R-123]
MVRLVRAAMIATLALGGSLLAAAPADAAVIDLTCVSPNSQNVTTFNPPLTLVNQPTVVQRTTKYEPCRAPRVPQLNSGFETKTITMNDDCTMVLLTLNVNFTITWNTGATSTISAVRTATISGGQLIVTFNGTVTAGLFAGSSAKQVFTANATDLINCLNGVGKLPSIVSKVQLTIFH